VAVKLAFKGRFATLKTRSSLLLLDRFHIIDQEIDLGFDLLRSEHRHEGSRHCTWPEHECISPHRHFAGAMGGDPPRSYNEVVHFAGWEDSVVVLRQNRQVGRFPLQLRGDGAVTSPVNTVALSTILPELLSGAAESTPLAGCCTNDKCLAKRRF